MTIALLRTTLLILLALHNAASAAEKNHKHGKVSTCPYNQPDYRCAKTMSHSYDDNGRLWRVWTNEDQLYIDSKTRDADRFSSPVKVLEQGENISAGNEYRPKIKTWNNRIYISWTQKLPKRFTGHIRFTYSDNAGTSFKTPITVNDNLEMISHRFDAIEVNSKGDIFISWLDKRDQQQAKNNAKDYKGAAAYYAVSTDGGLSFSPNIKLADHSCECCRMAMAIDNSNLPVISWRHIYGDNIRDHAIATLQNSQTPHLPERMSFDQWQIDGCPHHGPALSIDTNNRFHSVWFNNAEKRHGIYYAYSDDNGRHFSTPIVIGNYNRQAAHADVLTAGNNVYLSWTEYSKPYRQLYVQHSDDGGHTWKKANLIHQSLNKTDYAVLLKYNNQVSVSWHIPGVDSFYFDISDDAL